MERIAVFPVMLVLVLFLWSPAAVAEVVPPGAEERLLADAESVFALTDEETLFLKSLFTYGQGRRGALHVRGEIIEWLCADDRIKNYTGRNRVVAYACEISEMDFSGLHSSVMLMFIQCYMDYMTINGATFGGVAIDGCGFGGIIAKNSTFSAGIYVSDSKSEGIDLVECIVKGAVELNSLEAYGVRLDSSKFDFDVNIDRSNINWLSLQGANIFGSFLLQGGIVDPGGPSVGLHADGVTIGKNLLIRNTRFESGYVNLRGVRIGGSAEFDGSTMVDSPSGLVLNNCNIGRNLFTRNGFDARCKIDMTGTFIGGSFECANATIGDGTVSVEGWQSNIMGHFYCSNSTLLGAVQFNDSLIDGNVDLAGTLVSARDGDAVNFEQTKISGSAFLRNGFIASSEVSFHGADVGGNIEFDGSIVRNIGGTSINCENAHVGSYLLLRDGLKTYGQVVLDGAKVGSDVICSNSTFTGDKTAMTAEALRVGGNFKTVGAVLNGQLWAIGAHLGNSLICNGTRFHGKGGVAIQADGLKAGGFILLRDGFQADGMLDFSGAETVHFALANCTEPVGYDLDLDGARVSDYRDDRPSWPRSLNLVGLRIDSFDHRSPISAEDRLEWLGRLRTFHPQPYALVARVLDESGRHEDAAKISIRQHRLEEQFIDDPATYAVSRLYGIFLGYGYQTWRALCWLGGVVACGALFFRLAWGNELLARTPAPSREEPDSCDSAHRFNSFVYALDLSLPFVNLKQAECWQPKFHCDSGKVLTLDVVFARLRIPACKVVWGYYWVHIIFSWVLITFYVVGLAGMVRG